MTKVTKKAEFFRGLAKIERKHKRKFGWRKLIRRKWSFIPIRNDLWTLVKTGQKTTQEVLAHAEDLGRLCSGAQVKTVLRRRR
jgi:hypothetical protein